MSARVGEDGEIVRDENADVVFEEETIDQFEDAMLFLLVDSMAETNISSQNQVYGKTNINLDLIHPQFRHEASENSSIDSLIRKYLQCF